MKFSTKLASLIGISALVCFGMAPVSAHTTLTTSDPANGSRITTWPAGVTLNFAEPLLIIKGKQVSQVQITNSLAQSVGGAITVTNTKIVAATKPNSAPGPVLVSYRVAAADGHVVEGEFTFDYEPGGTPSTSASGPSTPSASPSASVNSDHSHGGNASTIIKASTGLVVLALIVGIFVYRRKL